MFVGCENLERFNINLSKLVYGDSMFEDCVKLTDFNVSSLDKLKFGNEMFKGCARLRSFDYETPKMLRAISMFENCKNLKHFNGDLSSLINGSRMFKGCKLDTESVKNIAETIKKLPKKKSPEVYFGDYWITIGVDVLNDEKQKYIEIIKKKNWNVRVE